MGQNFILDMNILRKIANSAGRNNNIPILEIGAGPGGLTRALLETAASTIIAIEKDQRCMPALNQISSVANGRLKVLMQDALTLDYEKLVTTYGKLRVVANLPYNIAIPLLIKWLNTIECFDSFVLTLQSEVAGRLTASTGSKAYGRLSIATQWRCEVKTLFQLKSEVFFPIPKVNSSVIKLLPRAQTLAQACPRFLEKIVSEAFSSRRKMIRSTMKKSFDNPILALEEAGISPTSRPEDIAIKDFCCLARILEKNSQ